MRDLCKHVCPNNGVENNGNTGNFVTSSSQSVLNSESFDSNTSTSFVNIAFDGVVMCNTLKSSSNNSCNVTKYSNLDVIDGYRSICSSDVSLATVSRRRGTSQKASPNSTNSGDGCVCTFNTTNTPDHELNFMSTVLGYRVPLVHKSTKGAVLLTGQYPPCYNDHISTHWVDFIYCSDTDVKVNKGSSWHFYSLLV